MDVFAVKRYDFQSRKVILNIIGLKIKLNDKQINRKNSGFNFLMILFLLSFVTMITHLCAYTLYASQCNTPLDFIINFAQAVVYIYIYSF